MVLDIGPGLLSAIRYVATLAAVCWLIRQWWLARTRRLE